MGIVDFVKRHQRKIYVALGLSASIYWALGWVGAKLRDVQERLILDRLTREDLERRFEQNQKDATFTTMALLPTLSTQVLDEYNVEETRRELQELRSAEKGTTELASSQELANSMSSVQSSQSRASGGPGTDAGSESGTAASVTVPSSSVNSGVARTEPLAGSVDSSFVSAPSKAELWNKIKIDSLTRAVLLVYASALLTVFTRVQLNILGRKSYAESIEHATADPGSLGDAVLLDDEQTDAVNRKYLTFSWWLLHKGWRLLAQRVKAAVEVETANVEPPQRLTFVALNELIGRIHKHVDEQGSLLGSLLPPPELETFVLSQIPGEQDPEVDEQLRALLDESRDILETPSCVEVVQRLVHSGLAVLMQKMRPLYPENTEDGDVRLAIALMQAAKQAHQMAAGSPLSNEYVEAMIDVPELDALSAAVYSNY